MKHLIGNIATLASQSCATWRGWVIYSWDMGFTCHLFDKEPTKWSGDGSYNFDGAMFVDPELLRECGIDIAYDVMDEAGRKFYYGRNSDGHGNHKAISIELTLPKGLLRSMVRFSGG